MDIAWAIQPGNQQPLTILSGTENILFSNKLVIFTKCVNLEDSSLRE